jgi:hypothetical protein
MNLFERFWKTVDERREAYRNDSDDFDVVLTSIHPPSGVKSEAARDLTSIVRKAPRRFPPVVVSQPSISPRPFCLVYTVAGSELPQFHQLFEGYVDKNVFIADTLLRLRPHYELPYVLFVGDRNFFLYDAQLEELLRWGNDFSAIEEIFITPLLGKDSVMALWDAFPRKSFSQRSEEFGRWLDLWKARVGSRTNATPPFMQQLLQKVILLFLYDLSFGLNDPDLHLRLCFLEHSVRTRSKRQGQSQFQDAGFEGIAWLHEAAQLVRDEYQIHFLKWTQAESTFFALMGADARQHFSEFILDLFLLSHCKFAVEVQADVFSDPDSRLKLWKFSVTEILNIKRRLQADEINVYEPVSIDLEESGIGWALHVVNETLEYWRERSTYFAQQLAERKAVQVQFDMFQQPDLEHARVPMPNNIFEIAFPNSIRIFYDFPIERVTLEYLILVRILSFCRQNNLSLQSLDHISDVFITKDRIISLQEI